MKWSFFVIKIRIVFLSDIYGKMFVLNAHIFVFEKLGHNNVYILIYPNIFVVLAAIMVKAEISENLKIGSYLLDE